jgi:hypothetical protein
MESQRRLRSILVWRESTHDFVIARARRRGGGKRGRVVLKVRDNSHGETVLVTNDDDILGYKS